MTSPIASAATAAAATAAELRRAPHRAVRHCEIRASMAPRPPGAAQAHHGRALPRPERRQRHRASASAARSKARICQTSLLKIAQSGTVRCFDVGDRKCDPPEWSLPNYFHSFVAVNTTLCVPWCVFTANGLFRHPSTGEWRCFGATSVAACAARDGVAAWHEFESVER